MRRQVRVGGALTALATAVALGAAITPAYAEPPEPSHATGKVDWKPCPDVPNVDCGTVTVPIDWSRPHGPTIEIALARQKATDPVARIGSILIDPGGPGGSGVDVAKGGEPFFSPEVHRRFDLVGFDPRGVGGSHPVLCDADLAFTPTEPVPSTAEQIRQTAEHNRALGESCRTLTGPLFDFLDNKSVVRDMDAIRAALGERKLTYYGISYGTLMGQQYAQMFPHSVRALVLDSNMDHSQATTWSFLRSESKGAQENFDQYVAWCQRSTECALHGQDVRRVFAELYARAERGELIWPGTTEKIPAFQLLAMTNGAFYGPAWKQLSQMHAQLWTGKADPAVTAQAKKFAEEPVHDPFASIFCQDWRLPVHNVAELQAYRLGLSFVAPDMKLSPLAWGATLACVDWPARVRNPQEPLRVKGAPPILMVNSRYDPATPYEWATNAARQSGAVLLTYDGWGHGVYWKGSTCVTDATDRYLITGQAPARGTHCAGVEPPTGPQVSSLQPRLPKGPPRWVG